MIDLQFRLPLARFDLDVSARLDADVTVLMGPSGSGKTSVLEAIAGLRPQAVGRIAAGTRVLLDSQAGVSLKPERRHVGYVPQDAALFPHLTALQNIRFGARGNRARGDAAIALLEVEPVLGRRPASLSGGERQRVALARALATGPEILLLDEPLAALETSLRGRILPYLLRLRREWSIPLLYVTHHIGEAMVLGGELLLLEAGKVSDQGPPMRLLGRGPSSDAPEGLENVHTATVATHDTTAGVTRVDLGGGVLLSVPLQPSLPTGHPVVVSVRAEDVLLASEEPRHISARNVMAVNVLTLTPSGHDVIVGCAPPEGAAWMVRVTRGAVADLGLAPGRQAWLAVKSHSVRIL